MRSDERQGRILGVLKDSRRAVSGSSLAKTFGVSRQVIVSDMAALRARGLDIISTNKGYLLTEEPPCNRIFKLRHTDEQVGEELETIVDCGGSVRNVFVNHKMYGRLTADMNISSRRQIADYLDDIKYGKSTPLKNVTSGYHYHTVSAKSEEQLDMIERELRKKGLIVE